MTLFREKHLLLNTYTQFVYYHLSLTAFNFSFIVLYYVIQCLATWIIWRCGVSLRSLKHARAHTGTFASMRSRKSVHLAFVANVMHPGSFRAIVAAGLRLNGRIDHVFRMRFPPTTLSRWALPAPRPIANRSINPLASHEYWRERYFVESSYCFPSSLGNQNGQRARYVYNPRLGNFWNRSKMRSRRTLLPSHWRTSKINPYNTDT